MANPVIVPIETSFWDWINLMQRSTSIFIETFIKVNRPKDRTFIFSLPQRTSARKIKIFVRNLIPMRFSYFSSSLCGFKGFQAPSLRCPIKDNVGIEIAGLEIRAAAARPTPSLALTLISAKLLWPSLSVLTRCFEPCSPPTVGPSSLLLIQILCPIC